MSICLTCQQQGYLRCNCESQQPFCDQCAEDTRCTSKMDAQCVIYHFDTQTPSQLTCLGIPNGANLETILEAIDDLVCNSFNIPFEPVNTESISWEAGGPAGHKPKANVIISPDAENSLILRENGLYAITDGRVKVDVDDTLDYLENQIEGSSSPSGVNITVTNVNHKLVIEASIDVDSFAEGLCENATFQECLENSETPITGVDTQSVNLTTSGVNDHVIQADVIISELPDNSLVLVADGLYVPTSPSGVSSAQNGANDTVAPGFIELGGELLHDTSIDINDNTILNGLAVVATRELNAAFHSTFNTFAKYTSITGAHVGATGYEFATAGQLWMDTSTATALRTGIAFYSGLYGAAIKSGSGDVSGNILSGGHFLAAVAGPGDVQSMAGVRIGAVIDPPDDIGPAFSGAFTNYYGLYIDDVSTSFGSPANTYGAYINGTGASFANVVEEDWTVISDSRIKENIKTSVYGLAEIEKLRTVEFTFNADQDPTQLKNIGFIAQEVESVLPEAVMQRELKGFTDFRLLDKNVIFSVMVNAIKELSEKVRQLENR